MNRSPILKPGLLLVAILFSFGLSIYNSLHFASEQYQGHNKVNVHQHEDPDFTNELVSEELENENDTESFLTDAFFLLSFALSTDVLSDSPRPFSYIPFAATSCEPIYISICVLRI